MNQPTREEFEAFKQEIRHEMRQRTEEIRTVRVEVASQDVINRLDELEQNQKVLFDVMIKTVEDNVKDLRNDLKQDMAAMKEEIIDAVRKYSQPGGNGH